MIPLQDIRNRAPRRKLSELTLGPLVGVALGMAFGVAAQTTAHISVGTIAALADPQVSSW